VQVHRRLAGAGLEASNGRQQLNPRRRHAHAVGHEAYRLVELAPLAHQGTQADERILLLSSNEALLMQALPNPPVCLHLQARTGEDFFLRIAFGVEPLVRIEGAACRVCLACLLQDRDGLLVPVLVGEDDGVEEAEARLLRHHLGRHTLGLDAGQDQDEEGGEFCGGRVRRSAQAGAGRRLEFLRPRLQAADGVLEHPSFRGGGVELIQAFRVRLLGRGRFAQGILDLPADEQGGRGFALVRSARASRTG